MPRTHSESAALGSGAQTVIYTHTTGKSYSAIVTSDGAGANELNLRVPSLKGTAAYELTDVDRRTTNKGGAGYLGRWSL
jgi:hypothetical protein